MAKYDDSKKSKKAKSETAPKSISVGGNVEKSVLIDGSNNVINNYYYEVVSTNIEKHDPDYWNLKHPYPMPPNFTGRVDERKMLVDWLNNDNENRLFILRALGGFGKSALSWHWLTNDVDSKEWTKVLWWDFYQGDGSFDNFIKEALEYLKIPVPDNQRAQVDELLKAMQAQKILIIMDGFERLLRAYSSMNAAHQGDEGQKREPSDGDCLNTHAEHFLRSLCVLPTLKGKALMTTRLTPRALIKFEQLIQGCHEEELKAMYKDDAIAFFRAQGVQKGANHEIEKACKLYGFHPLSLRLLAGYIMADLKNAGDISVAQSVKIKGNISEQQNHILETSYNSLPPHQQKLLSVIACFRSSTKLDTLESIAKNVGAIGESLLEDDLRALIERGLLQYDKANKVFDLHPIVRRYAYECFLDKDRKNTHVKLAEHFIDAMPVTNKNVKTLQDLAPVIELYHHMVRAGNLDEAMDLYYNLLWKTIYYQLGSYQTEIELLLALFPDGENHPPKLNNKSAQGWILNELANAYKMSGQPRGISFYKSYILIAQAQNDKRNELIGFGNLGSQQLNLGELHDAELNLRQSISLSREIQRDYDEACGLQQLGRLLAYRGAWEEADHALSSALAIMQKLNHVQSEGLTWAYLSLLAILKTRTLPKFQSTNPDTAIQFAQRALKLAEEIAKTNHPLEYDLIRAHWLIGAANHLNNQIDMADNYLTKALTRCRVINNVEIEADILLDLARLRYAQGDFKDAQEKASEALVITERSGYVLQGADVNLFLSQYTLEQEKDKVKAKEYAETALKLAYCDGLPYYYKVAYHEAEELLKKIDNEK